MMDYDKEQELNKLGEKLRKEYKEIIVDFIVYDEKADKILIQKRSLTRNMFPGEWEFPGGHLEPNEDLVGCIKREVYEEGQMYLTSVVDAVHVFTWDSDKDVANIQCLVNASGTFTPNKDKISEYKFIGRDGLDLLLEKKRESQIYRGVFYAFEYMRMLRDNTNKSFESILFFDQLITGFFNFLRCEESAPKVIIGKEQDKKFSLDKEQGILSIAPSFLKHYDNFGCASIILHLIFHNYRQNILSYDDIKTIRSLMGKNVMFYVDIVADVYTFLFLERYYSFDQRNYLLLCHRLIKEYQAEDIENSKLTRLFGTALSIANREGQGFDVFLPVLDERSSKLYIVRFDKLLTYKALALDKTLTSKIGKLMIAKTAPTEKEFLGSIEKIISLVEVEK